MTTPDAIPDADPWLRAWLEAGFHGSMTWMDERVDERAHPASLWPDVKSIVMLGLSYAPKDNVLDDLQHKDRGTISAYARSRDYHDVIKSRLKRLARFIIDTKRNAEKNSNGHNAAEVKVFVDTAPVMEKALAHAAGLGWQGKHTVLVSREQGSWTFLGAIYTNFELPADSKSADHCGTCMRCLCLCPTDAFPAPYQLDSNKCIAYLTIEHKGPIDRALRSKIGNRIFGCDDCLAVCPWNRFSKPHNESKFEPNWELLSKRNEEWESMNEETFKILTVNSPLKRTGFKGIKRNISFLKPTQNS